MKKAIIIAALLTALCLSASAEETRWVDPVTSTRHIVENTRAWVNYKVPISASFEAAVKQPDGRWLATTTPLVLKNGAMLKGDKSLNVVLTPEAYAYHLERKAANAPQTYLGEVVPGRDGILRLYLFKGLTYTRNRPDKGKPAPALKAVP